MNGAARSVGSWLWERRVEFLAFGLAVVIYAPAIFGVGLLSDDWGMVHNAKLPILGKIQHHHWSPYLRLLFRLHAEDGLPLPVWKAAVIALHGINAILVYRLSLRLEVGSLGAVIAALLFAAAPAGVEAVVWTCTSGYVVTTTFLLASLLLFLGKKRGGGLALNLALLQFLALLAWDYSVVIAPVLVAVGFGQALFADKRMRRRQVAIDAAVLAPALAVGLASLVLRHVYSVDAGYGLRSLQTIAYLSPRALMLSLWPPLALRVFWVTAVGLACLALCAFGLWIARRRSAVWVAGGAYWVCMAPALLVGGGGARHLYPGLSLLLPAIAGIVASIPHRRIRILVGATLVILHGFWASEAVGAWGRASEQAHSIRDQILAFGPPESTSVIVNLPTYYDAAGVFCRPYMWRHGVEALGPTPTCVRTPKAPCVETDLSYVVELERSEVRERYPEGAVLEVLWEPSSEGPDFRVVPFQSVVREDSEDEQALRAQPSLR